MDFLGGEIAKLKRKAPSSDQKYIRRSDLELQRQEEYRKDQEQLTIARQEREHEKRRKIHESETERLNKMKMKTLESTSSDSSTVAMAGEVTDIVKVRKELIEMSEPIRLFAESDTDTANRLQQLAARREKQLSTPKGMMREAFSDPTDELLPDPDTIKLDLKWIKSDLEDDRDSIYRNLFLVFRGYLKSWTPDAQSPHDLEVYAKARDHLSRLLIRLKSKSLPSDILKNLTLIAIGLQKRDYTAANHAYLQMSIGKATWPVGVTMVGIHERAQRERQHKQVDGAHILADEMTRQWLQSLKRLITQLEKQNR